MGPFAVSFVLSFATKFRSTICDWTSIEIVAAEVALIYPIALSRP